ncbi:paladin [Eurytemora carolleeae]|uniref:paladin n=1 Tax=Eurytemora carolleeae TaxID=1294199 RepID=UPI000C75AD4A|nr:paladin [Eurytemora carolleeae]|eukprot:XP_023341546.1 paladin-like [Eurytemora affinis]
MDLSTCVLKLDHSVGDPQPYPNFRQIPGFPVYGVGQPTEAGFSQLAEKIPKEKTIWFNVRQEPVVYINGLPCAPRTKDNLHENITLSLKQAELNDLQVKFAKSIDGMQKDGCLELHKDKDFQENPMEREDFADTVKTESIKDFNSIIAGLAETSMPGLTVVRVPFQEERPLPEDCFDIIVSQLANESPSTTQCVFNSQAGKGRSTMGTVIACIIKASQMIIKLNKMVEEGMAEKSWADGIIRKKFEDPLPSEDLKDPFLRGEFDVIKELLESVPECAEGKVLADKMIDMCGVPPEGTGLQNIRKCIIETKYKYDASTEDKQVVWKRMIINFIERYFYLICFATYARAQAKDEFKKTFVSWMDEHSNLR